MTKPRVALSLIYLLLAGLYLVAVPAWEAPDEPAHYIYARSLLETGAPPPVSGPQPEAFWQNGYLISTYEWHQLPLYYALAVPPLAANRALGILPANVPFPPVNPAYPVLTHRVFLPTAAPRSEVYVLRLLSVLFGLGTMWHTAALAQTVFPGQRWLPELAAGLVAFIPQFTFLHAYANNDTLAILASSAVMLAAARLAVRERPVPQDWLRLGLALGLALATKLTTFFVLAPACAVLVYHLARRSTSLGSALPRLAAALPLPVLIAAAWPAWLGQLLHDESIRVAPARLNPVYLWGLLSPTHQSFWGCFGWMNIGIPRQMLWCLDAGLVVGLLAAAWSLWREWQQMRSGVRLAVGLLALAPLLTLGQFVLFNLTTYQAQGRLLYPALPPLMALVAYGWLRLAGRQRGLVTLLLLAGLAGVNLASLVFTLLPTYPE